VLDFCACKAGGTTHQGPVAARGAPENIEERGRRQEFSSRDLYRFEKSGGIKTVAPTSLHDPTLHLNMCQESSRHRAYQRRRREMS